MARIANVLPVGFFGLACALAAASCSQPVNDLKSLPTIKADKAHQINIESKNNLSYEVPSGKGFVLDTSEYQKEYAQPSSIRLDVEVSKGIRLDPIAPTKTGPVEVNLVPGRDLYQVCPNGGLRSGDRFTVQIREEITDLGHYEVHPAWTALVTVR